MRCPAHSSQQYSLLDTLAIRMLLAQVNSGRRLGISVCVQTSTRSACSRTRREVSPSSLHRPPWEHDELIGNAAGVWSIGSHAYEEERRGRWIYSSRWCHAVAVTSQSAVCVCACLAIFQITGAILVLRHSVFSESFQLPLKKSRSRR